MMKLEYIGGEIEADEVLRKADTITCKIQGNIIAEFKGISDFSGYTLKNAEGITIELIELPIEPDALEIIILDNMAMQTELEKLNTLVETLITSNLGEL